MQNDVIVVGGGVAGLMAAIQLAAKGISASVVEAGSQAGGRIKTFSASVFDSVLETGAEFIHGNLPLTTALLREAAIPFHKPPGKRVMNENGKWKNGNNEAEAGWGKAMKKMHSLEKDIPLHEFLENYLDEDKDGLLKKRIRHYAEGFDLADTNTASTLALMQEWENEEEEIYRVEGGYGRLVDYLVDKCAVNHVDVYTNSAVKKVVWRKGQVRVHLENGEVLEAARAIITVPLKQLQDANSNAEGMFFEPPIPAYTGAAQKIGFGTVIKIFFQFSDAFWLNKAPGAGFIISNQIIPTWWTQAGESKMLTGWLGGPPAKALSKADEKIIVRLALESLGNIFAVDAELLGSILKAWKVCDWSQEKFVHGAYSFDTVESVDARKLLQAPLDDTLFFAGEAVYPGEAPGTVEAALLSGVTAADKLAAVDKTAMAGI